MENHQINLEFDTKSTYDPIYYVCKYQNVDTIKYIQEIHKINFEYEYVDGSMHERRYNYIRTICQFQKLNAIKYVFENNKPNFDSIDCQDRSIIYICCQYQDESTIEYIFDNYVLKMNTNSINNIVYKVGTAFYKTGVRQINANMIDLIKYRGFTSLAESLQIRLNQLTD
jgi:hypothetical protein